MDLYVESGAANQKREISYIIKVERMESNALLSSISNLVESARS